MDSVGTRALADMTMYADENTGVAVPGIWVKFGPAADGSGRRVPVRCEVGVTNCCQSRQGGRRDACDGSGRERRRERANTRRERARTVARTDRPNRAKSAL